MGKGSSMLQLLIAGAIAATAAAAVRPRAVVGDGRAAADKRPSTAGATPPPADWALNLTLSVPRSSLAAASSGDVLVFAGGLTATGPTDVVDIFDFATNPPTHTTAKLSAPRTFDGGQNIGAALGKSNHRMRAPFESPPVSPKTEPQTRISDAASTLSCSVAVALAVAFPTITCI